MALVEVMAIFAVLVIGTLGIAGLAVVVVGGLFFSQRRYLKAGGQALEAQRSALSGQIRPVLGNPVLTGTRAGCAVTAQFSNSDASSAPVAGRGFLQLKVSGLVYPGHLELRIGPRAPLARLGAGLTGLTLVETDARDLSILTSEPEVTRRLLADPSARQHLRDLLGSPPGRLELSGPAATLYYSAPQPATVNVTALVDALLALVQGIPE